MQMKALLSTSLLRRASMLGVLLIAAIFATSAQALDEPKVTITYSLEVGDGGAYWQELTDTGFDDVYYVMDIGDPQNGDVTVTVDSPLLVVMEFTADLGGNIIDGPVELIDSHFEREFEIDSGGLLQVTTQISTFLSRAATGDLAGTTITWDNVVGVNAYQEAVTGASNCVSGFGLCGLAGPWPKDLGIGSPNEVPLPTFSVFTNSVFADGFASDGGTVGTPADDIVRPDPAATVRDTWHGAEISRVVAFPVPAISEIYLLVGTLGLVGLGCLRKRNGASA
jgi:hypothetical protein